LGWATHYELCIPGGSASSLTLLNVNGSAGTGAQSSPQSSLSCRRFIEPSRVFASQVHVDVPSNAPPSGRTTASGLRTASSHVVPAADGARVSPSWRAWQPAAATLPSSLIDPSSQRRPTDTDWSLAMFPWVEGGAPSRYARRYEVPRGRDDHAMVKRKPCRGPLTTFEGLLRRRPAAGVDDADGRHVLSSIRTCSSQSGALQQTRQPATQISFGKLRLHPRNGGMSIAALGRTPYGSAKCPRSHGTQASSTQRVVPSIFCCGSRDERSPCSGRHWGVKPERGHDFP
jgi:hypothetical protein